MGGIFDLRTPVDLYAKLGRELGRMRMAPDDVDPAFNFFVTAEHLPDWIHPGDDKDAKDKQNAMRRATPELRVASHIANGAKHFGKLQKKHKSIAKLITSNALLSLHPIVPGMTEAALVVYLADDEARELEMESIPAVNLAERVNQYWCDQLRIRGLLAPGRSTWSL